MKHLVVLSCVAVLSCVVLGARNPYTRIEAESMDFNHGVEILSYSPRSGAKYIEKIHRGDYFGFKELNFNPDTVAIEWEMFNYGATHPVAQVSLRLDTPTSTPFLTYSLDSALQLWHTYTILIPVCERPCGVHDLYFTIHRSNETSIDSYLVAFDWFRFVTLESLMPPSYKTVAFVDCPTPRPVMCQTPQPNVQPTTDHHLRIGNSDNSTDSQKQINIYIY